jgi:hypothetical protein
VKVKLFLQSSDKIFDDFYNVVSAVEDKRANDEEIKTILSMYKDLSFILDGVFLWKEHLQVQWQRMQCNCFKE